MPDAPFYTVIAEFNGMLHIRTGPVQPHIALRLRRLSRLVQHLYLCFILVQKVSGEQQLPQHAVNRRKPNVRAAQQPVGHGLPGKRDALAIPFLLLPIQRGAHGSLWKPRFILSYSEGYFNLPSGFTLTNFHHQVVAHAGRTRNSTGELLLLPNFLLD